MKEKCKYSIQRGTTLIELSIYMGILAILLTVFASLFTSVIDVQLESATTSRVNQDGRYLLAKLAYDLDNSQSIVAPAAPSASTSSTLTIQTNTVNSTYSLNGSGNLQVVTGSNTDVLNSADTTISDVMFQRIGNGTTNDTVQIRFTVTSKTQRTSGVAESQQFQTTLGL